MDPQIAERIRRGWRAELVVPAAFGGQGRHVHLRPAEDPARPGWVGVVALGDSTCVSLPPCAPERRHDVGWRDLDADLTDSATVARVIGPVEEFVGPATLAFLDPTAVDLGDDPQIASVAAGHEAVRQLAAACGPHDAQESGILTVESSVAVWQVAGRVVAASGYQVWHGQLGHLSVLHPEFRGRGLGKAVAARVVAQVVEPAWCRSGEPAARWSPRAASPEALACGTGPSGDLPAGRAGGRHPRLETVKRRAWHDQSSASRAVRGRAHQRWLGPSKTCRLALASRLAAGAYEGWRVQDGATRDRQMPWIAQATPRAISTSPMLKTLLSGQEAGM
jgi:GNAT superfamily N-acetyltransferase